MSIDILAILFIAFSVISSLVSKWQARQKMGERQERERRGEAEPVPPPQVPDFDLSEWDVFREPEPEKPAQDPEFREVRGARPVEEPDDVKEFQEVRGKREVSEEYTGPEFRRADIARPVSEADTGPEYRHPLDDDHEHLPGAPAAGIPPVRPRRSRGRKRRLKFDNQSLVDAILYKEILGPPRSENPYR